MYILFNRQMGQSMLTCVQCTLAYQTIPHRIYNRTVKHIIGILNEPQLNKTLLLSLTYFAFDGTRHKTSDIRH